jgi:hypothetical protein
MEYVRGKELMPNLVYKRVATLTLAQRTRSNAAQQYNRLLYSAQQYSII